jgi:Fe-S cluster biogenesis protein NfuA
VQFFPETAIEDKRCPVDCSQAYHTYKEMQPMIEKVQAVLEQVRPMLQRDGGDVELVEVTADNIVKVKLQGACGSCPMSTMTLKMGIEKAIKEQIPEIVEVQQVR